MKVKIVKCSHKDWWYNNLIGNVIDVEIIYIEEYSVESRYTDQPFWYELTDNNHMKIKNINKEFMPHGLKDILINDCIIFNREEKLKRILQTK